MIKQTIIAASALAAAVFAFQPPQAQAGTNFDLHIGVPNYGHYGTPYYGGHVYYGAPAYRPRRHYRVGCREARRLLHHRGFRHIRTHDCHGSRYVFKARRRGDWWIVRVSSRTGRILRIRPI